MGKRVDIYNLKGMLEQDVGYFKIETNQFEKSKTEAGRENTDVQNIIVVVKSTPLEDANGNESKHCGYYKMKVMETHQAEEITQAVAEMIQPECIFYPLKA